MRLQSFLASAAVVCVACLLYRYAPFDFHRRQFGDLYGALGFRFTGEQFLAAAALAYIALLAGFHAIEPTDRPSKALRSFQLTAAFARSPAALVRNGLAPQDRVAVLATLLKAFFGPLMTVSLLVFCQGVLVNGQALASEGLGVPRHLFWFTLQVIFFVDVLIFTVGYLVETPRLGNEIRSVDPTLLGWTAAMLCYPPFNAISGFILGSKLSDFPQFDNPTLHLVLNISLLVLMAIYASASIAMGWKASNLTHRGLVDRGPYAVVRHPAYVCKNMAWWIGSYPLAAAAFSESWLSGVQAMASVAGWTLLYVLRALTEEDHLKRVDGDYAVYAAQVRWRFIPGLV